MLRRVRQVAVGAFLTMMALALNSAAGSAQTITGTVASGGKPVVGATVRLLDLDRIDRTGSAGKFSFSGLQRGTYRISAEAFGYASITDTVRLTGTMTAVTLELNSSPFPLHEIVVSAAPTPRPASELYQPVASKGRMEFATSPGTMFAEKLGDLPGVAVRGLGSAPTRPVLRGLSDNEVLVLENSLRMGDIATYDPAHATPLTAMSIEQIDVVRGPATVLYGPSTIGGLVNVITNIVPRVATRGVSGLAAIEGSTGSSEASGYFTTVLSGAKSAFQVSAGGLHTGDIRIPSKTYIDPETGTPFPLDKLPQSFDHSLEGGAGYAYQGAFGSLGLGARHYEMNYGIPGVPANPDFEAVPPTTSRIAQTRNTVEMRGLFNMGTSLNRLKLTAAYNDYNHREFPTAQDASGITEPEANHFHKRELNAVLQLQHRPLGRLSGTVGLWTDIQNLTIEGDQPLGPNSVTTGLAGFGFEELRASSSTRLQVGARFDYNKIQTHPFPESTDPVFQTLNTSRTSNAVTASLGVLQQLSTHLNGSLNVARSFRAPTVQELFANGLDAPSGTFTIGTSTLTPETGVGIDASLKGSFGRLAFELSPYLNFIQHHIYGFLRGDTIEEFPVRQFTATAARLIGFEASATVAPAPDLVLYASSDYVRAEDTDNHVALPFIPPLRGLLRMTYQNDKYMARIEMRAASSQNRLGDGDTPTSGYGVVNLGVGVHFVHQGLVSFISLHADNVFNRDYRDHLSVIKDFLPQPGRAIRLNYELLY